MSSATDSFTIAVPGDALVRSLSGSGFIRGHGTALASTHVARTSASASASAREETVVASVAGPVLRTNRLVSVSAAKARYAGEVGDLVVGRVSEVGAKRWRVDLGATLHAVLALSSINLPGGQQRIRTLEDQLHMRAFFQERDLLSAEVQSVTTDGTIMLHARSLKNGKLANGFLVTVPACLVRRQQQHTVTLAGGTIGVEVLLGNNGFIWAQRAVPSEWFREVAGEDEDPAAPTPDTLQHLQLRHANTPTSPEDFQRLIRVRAAIMALRSVFAPITPDAIVRVYHLSLARQMSAWEMQSPSNMLALTHGLRFDGISLAGSGGDGDEDDEDDEDDELDGPEFIAASMLNGDEVA